MLAASLQCSCVVAERLVLASVLVCCNHCTQQSGNVSLATPCHCEHAHGCPTSGTFNLDMAHKQTPAKCSLHITAGSEQYEFSSACYDCLCGKANVHCQSQQESSALVLEMFLLPLRPSTATPRATMPATTPTASVGTLLPESSCLLPETYRLGCMQMKLCASARGAGLWLISVCPLPATCNTNVNTWSSQLAIVEFEQ